MRKKLLGIVILAVSFILVSVTFLATAQVKNQPIPSKTPAKQPAPQTANNISQAAYKSGVRTCAGRINQITNFLSAGVNAGYMMFFSKTNPDQQMASVSMEIPVNNNTAYASVSVAPGQASYCGGIYETVVYWPQNCAAVEAQNFGSLKKGKMLSKNISVRDGGDVKVFLMPAGAGCVSIKKEMVR